MRESTAENAVTPPVWIFVSRDGLDWYKVPVVQRPPFNEQGDPVMGPMQRGERLAETFRGRGDYVNGPYSAKVDVGGERLPLGDGAEA